MTVALTRVHADYARMVQRLEQVQTSPVADPALSAEMSMVLAAEARLLDARAFDQWQALLSDDMMFWIPIHPADHLARDQALIFDDRRRISERVAHLSDPQAWSVVAPYPLTTRQIGVVEAWDTGTEILATAPIELLHVRRGPPMRLLGREVLSLTHTGQGPLITSKTLILPELVLSSPHLGWIL